jgi:hypothetical protein
MAENELEGLLASHQIQCRGASAGHAPAPVFPEEEAESIIVNVYKDGKTQVLCRYMEPRRVIPRCNPEGRILGSEAEDVLGVCPYAKKR